MATVAAYLEVIASPDDTADAAAAAEYLEMEAATRPNDTADTTYLQVLDSQEYDNVGNIRKNVYSSRPRSESTINQTLAEAQQAYAEVNEQYNANDQLTISTTQDNTALSVHVTVRQLRFGTVVSS